MEKPNQDFSLGKKSNKDIHPSQLDEQSYIHMLNGNVENDGGDGILLQNEHSNILCSRFKDGFVSIGYQYDLTNNRVYYFLTHPKDRKSEIGFISNSPNTIDINDIEQQCGCDIVNKLSEPLEDKEQLETCTYQTLISDYDCPNNIAPNKCLNFDVKYPISSELKDEKCGKVIYFTDDLNPMRRIELENIDQYYELNNDNCGEESQEACIDCNKLLVQKPAKVPCINFKGKVSGGNLEHGVYVFYLAYCDSIGNEISRYSSITGEVFIKNDAKNIYQQPELDAVTNYSIRLDISDLDTRHDYYKIAVIQKTKVDGTISSFVVGVYSTTNNQVIYSSSKNKDRITVAEITAEVPKYLTAKTVESANNMLFFSDLTAQPEVNLQPVVNLIGQFAKWRTEMAEEGIYSDPLYCESHRGYMRDETYPISIRFFTDNYVTALFPLISRQPKDEDLYFDEVHKTNPTQTIQSIIDNTEIDGWKKDVHSILKNSNTKCTEQTRKYRWQYYNTATIERDGFSSDLPCGNVEFEEFDIDIRKQCSEEIITDIIGNITITDFEEDEQFEDMFRYVLDNQESICDNPTLQHLCVENKLDTECVECKTTIESFFSDTCDKENIAIIDGENTISVVGVTEPITLEIVDINLSASLATSFKEHHVDTTSNSISLFLPANPNEGDIIKIVDIGGNFKTNKVTVIAQGGKTVNRDFSHVLQKNNQVITYIYNSTIQDWSIDGIDIVYNSVSEYERLASPSFCNPYKTDNSGGGYSNINTYSDDDVSCGMDKEAEAFYGRPYSNYIGSTGKKKDRFDILWDREEVNVGGDTCSSAFTLSTDSDSYTPSTHINPIYSNTTVIVDGTPKDLVTNITSTSFSNVGGGYIKERRCLNPTPTSTYFKDKIHENAVWYKVANINESITELVINISEQAGCPDDRKDKDCAWYTNNIRVSFYKKCSSSGTSFIKAELVNIEDSSGNSGIIIIKSSINNQPLVEYLENDELYIAIDTPIVKLSSFYKECVDGEIQPIEDVYTQYISGTCGCIAIKASLPTIKTVNIVSNDKIILEKTCTYETQCETRKYEDIKCDPIPFSSGRFAYVESTDTYPDNKELYDSTQLKVSIKNIPVEYRTEFEEVFVSHIEGGKYVLKNETANFTCKNIRHFKFPDNNLVPIQDGDESRTPKNPPFQSNKIFPIGIYIDAELIDGLLTVAVENGLITQKFRDSIQGYEVFRGDVLTNKSIIAKGVLYDMYRYKEGNDENNYFSNFPFNQLGKNKLLYTNTTERDYIDEPYAGGNNRFMFHSPETSFEKPNIPFEMKVLGYLTGNSQGRFSSVLNHPKMVLLSERAYRLSKILGGIEYSIETISEITNTLTEVSKSGHVGTSTNILQGVAWAAFATKVAEIGANSIFSLNRKIYEWQLIFDSLGTPYNFASYYSSVGYYNSTYSNILEGNMLRGINEGLYLKSRRYKINEKYKKNDFESSFQTVTLNNIQRESGVFLGLGEYDTFGLIHPSILKNIDNSRITYSDMGCGNYESATDISNEITREICSPYVSLKNYVPNQYGTIDSIKWISTSYCGKIKNRGCDIKTIFGGDIFISRFSLKRKFPLFLNPMLTESGSLGDLTPFDYTSQRNVGYPRFYVDYKTDASANFGRIELPKVQSNFNLDCEYVPKLYVEPPSKFYLYYYGIPNFLVESRINLNYRYGENEREKDFYPNFSDYVKWTQEDFVGINNDNYYFYNNIYSTENNIYGYRTLPLNYNKKDWECRFDHWDRTIYSLPDNNEQDLQDNWSIFRGNNYYDFGNKYGTFYGLKSIESQKVLGRFEDGVVIFNAFNTIQGTVEDLQVGTGGVFATRPTEFFSSDIGYAGTQHRAFVTSEFGHFWTDAKRGRVFSVAPNGSNLEEISRYGWKNWFRENLPFNIAKKFPNISSDILDNPKNGLGIAMGWDDRYSRLFITKRDYIVSEGEGCCIEYKDGVGFVNNETKCKGTPRKIICPEGYTYNPETGLCEGQEFVPTSEPICPENFSYNVDTNLCEGTITIPKEGEVICPEEFTYNTVTGLCERTLQQPTLGGEIESGCEFDLMFNIDQSGSISVEEQVLLKSFINSILDLLEDAINREEVYVGLTSFNNYQNSIGHVVYPMTTGAGTVADLKNKVNNFATKPNGGTDINTGLCNAHYMLFGGRDNVDKKIITITDGVSLIGSRFKFDCNPYFSTINHTDTRDDLNTLNRENIVIGIEGDETFDVNLLNIIHNSTVNSGKAYLAEFVELEGLVNEIIDSVCTSEETCPSGWEKSGNICILHEEVEPTIGTTTEEIEITAPPTYEEDIEVVNVNIPPTFEDTVIPIDINNHPCVKDCSWTVAYSPLLKQWIGHYSFTPNYYISHNNYFQTGLNFGESKGVWSHLLTNKSFQVFYGVRYPWVIELPIKNSYTNKYQNSISYWLDVKRYHTENDFAENRNMNFSSAVIYNHDENSGKLNFITQERNNQNQLLQYPKYNSDSWDILATQEHRKWTFNTFFNLVKDKNNNVPIWIHDCANVNKELNNKALDYRPTYKDHIRGDWFMMKLIQDQESRYKYIFKWLTSKNKMYD